MRRVQLAVTFHSDVTRYYPVTAGQGWKVDQMYGVSLLVIGTGIPRTMIPLAGVQSFELAEYGSDDGARER